MNDALERSGFRVYTSDHHHCASNVWSAINEFSAFSRLAGVTSTDGGLVVDSYFGQIYDELPLEPHAIYGATTALPPFSIDRLSNHGFLRVPFRRIPRRVVGSFHELVSVLKPICTHWLSGPDPTRLLFRGQNQEYELPRQPEVREWLYGDSKAVEASLLPSGIRASVPFLPLMPLWNALVSVFVDDQIAKSRAAGLVESEASLRHDETVLGTTHDYALFATALAQHYGLPTTGLDVTDDLATALFFAFMRFEAAEGFLKATQVDRNTLPVLYVFKPAPLRTNAYSTYGPPALGISRPRAQSAHFLHSGWGLNTNSAARGILIAFYLNFDPRVAMRLPSTTSLFPRRDDDPFGTHLEHVRESVADTRLGQYLRHFHWVED